VPLTRGVLRKLLNAVVLDETCCKVGDHTRAALPGEVHRAPPTRHVGSSPAREVDHALAARESRVVARRVLAASDKATHDEAPTTSTHAG